MHKEKITVKNIPQRGYIPHRFGIYCYIENGVWNKIFSRKWKKGLTFKIIYDIISYADSDVREQFAGVAELADARDLKSRDTKVSYRFDPGHRHQRVNLISRSRAAW